MAADHTDAQPPRPLTAVAPDALHLLTEVMAENPRTEAEATVVAAELLLTEAAPAARHLPTVAGVAERPHTEVVALAILQLRATAQVAVAAEVRTTTAGPTMAVTKLHF